MTTYVKKFNTSVSCLVSISVTVASVVLPLNKLFCRLERVGTFIWIDFLFVPIRRNSLLPFFSVRSELVVLHNASALAQESATCNQTDLHCCSQSRLDSCETVVTLDTVARTPQSQEHVLVVSCIGASLLLSTMITSSGSGASLCEWSSD